MASKIGCSAAIKMMREGLFNEESGKLFEHVCGCNSCYEIASPQFKRVVDIGLQQKEKKQCEMETVPMRRIRTHGPANEIMPEFIEKSTNGRRLGMTAADVKRSLAVEGEKPKKPAKKSSGMLRTTVQA